MDLKRILGAVDHTLLNPAATWEQVRTVCDDGVPAQSRCSLPPLP